MATRTPRKWFKRSCERCHVEFVAFRKTAKYHKNICRVQAYHERTNRGERIKTLQKFHSTCVVCGSADAARYFVRRDPRRNNERVVLCPACNSALSRQLFHQRTS